MVVQLRDIVATEVLTTPADRPVVGVTAMMVKAQVGSAVVMQGAWLAGILTERDVCGRPRRVRISPRRPSRSG